MSLHTYPESPFNVGDLVMYRNRCQTTSGGMRVEEVDISMFDVRLKVDGKWWTPASFMPLAQWRAQMAAALH